MKTYRVTKEQLELMRKEGLGVTRIAKIIGVDHSTVRYYLKRYGLPTRLPVPTVTDDHIRRELDRLNRHMGR